MKFWRKRTPAETEPSVAELRRSIRWCDGCRSPIALFVLGFLWADDGWILTVDVILLAVFLFSIMPVIVAAAMDATDVGSEGTSVAVLFAGGSLIGAIAPVVAGDIHTSWNFDGVVIFVAALAAFGDLVSPRGRPTTA